MLFKIIFTTFSQTCSKSKSHVSLDSWGRLDSPRSVKLKAHLDKNIHPWRCPSGADEWSIQLSIHSLRKGNEPFFVRLSRIQICWSKDSCPVLLLSLYGSAVHEFACPFELAGTAFPHKLQQLPVAEVLPGRLCTLLSHYLPNPPPARTFD